MRFKRFFTLHFLGLIFLTVKTLLLKPNQMKHTVITGKDAPKTDYDSSSANM